ncbi:MAG: hypothetical protein PHU43_10005 [Candidatus Bipolaricaulis sp.]|nr:hypothetical protein [Candidatus Bipolaricaulis sp.]
MKNQMELKGYYVVKAVAQEDFPGAVDAYYGYGDADKSGANRWLEYCPTWLGAVVKGKKAAEALRANFRRAWKNDDQDVEYAILPLTDMSESPWWGDIEDFLAGPDAQRKDKKMNAKFIAEGKNGELRLATRKNQTWPGYHEGTPLGKAGYWYGKHENHEYLGRDRKKAVEYFEMANAL